MTAFSKIIKYGAITIAGLGFLELYHQFALMLKDRLQLDDNYDLILCTRQPINRSLRLTRYICFDDENPTMQTVDLIENILLSAQRSIHVAMYIFTSHRLAEALIKAHRRGVQVCVIIDDSMKNSSESRTRRLRDDGIQVKIMQDRTLHHKMCLIDIPFKGKMAWEKNPTPFLGPVPIPDNGLVICGSLNWTNDALMNNEETFVINSNPMNCQMLANKFSELWNDSVAL